MLSLKFLLLCDRGMACKFWNTLDWLNTLFLLLLHLLLVFNKGMVMMLFTNINRMALVLLFSPNMGMGMGMVLYLNMVRGKGMLAFKVQVCLLFKLMHIMVINKGMLFLTTYKFMEFRGICYLVPLVLLLMIKEYFINICVMLVVHWLPRHLEKMLVSCMPSAVVVNLLMSAVVVLAVASVMIAIKMRPMMRSGDNCFKVGMMVSYLTFQLLMQMRL